MKHDGVKPCLIAANVWSEVMSTIATKGAADSGEEDHRGQQHINSHICWCLTSRRGSLRENDADFKTFFTIQHRPLHC